MPLFTNGLAVKIGTYELPLGRWGEEASVEFDHRLIENQREHKWDLRGTITATSVATFAATLAYLKTVVETQGQDITITWQGQTLASLTAAECADGPLITRFRLPNSGEKFATVQPVEISIKAVVETATGNTLTDEHTIAYRSDSDGQELITIRGKFRTKKGVSAESVWTTTKKPSIPYGYGRQVCEVEYDDQDRDCSYRVEDKNLGGGEVQTEDNAEVTSETTVDAQGRRETTVAGFYSGDNAMSLAESHRPVYHQRLLRESIRQSLVTGRVDFSFRWLNMSTGSLLSWTSTVSKSGGGQFKDIITLAGTTPFIINGAQQVYRVEYSGSATAARTYPSAPSPPYAERFLAEPAEIVKDDPEPEIRRVSWRYRYIFETDPGGPTMIPRPN